MLKNYLLIACRTLKKHKVFSLINIAGLGLGIAAFWLIALYVMDEWSFDRYLTNADRIFRVAQHGKWNGGSFDLAVTSPPFGPTLKSEYPAVEEAVRIDPEGGGKIEAGNKKWQEGAMIFADKNLFQVFQYHFIKGDRFSALSDPASVVLTKSFAETLFPDGEALNRTILIDHAPYKITAILEDVPENSHFTFKAVRPLPDNYSGSWMNSGIYTYLLLKDPADVKSIEATSTSFYDKHLKNGSGDVNYTIELQPIKSIHLHSHLSFEFGNNGNITYLYIFSLTALLILLIAVINYVNLTTARSSIRVKEIGVRKAIGSGRRQIMGMFFAESVFLVFLSTCIALLLIYLSLPWFNQLADKKLSLATFGIIPSVSAMIIFSIVTGLLSGVYPALFLSSFGTISSLRGQTGNHFSNALFRRSLVVFQFVVTIVMIIGSIVIYRQLDFVSRKDLGFNKAQTLTFHINDQNVRTQTDAIRSRLLQDPRIESVAVAGNPIGDNNIGGGDFNLGPDGKINPDSKIVEWLQVGPYFIPTLEIKMAAGRNFFPGNSSDVSDAIIVNETLVKELNWKDAIGKRVRTGVDENGHVIQKTIIGVVRDFNTYSLQHKIEPMVLTLPSSARDGDNLYIRIGKKDVAGALSHITRIYHEFDKEDVPDYHFLDQNFAMQYRSEEKQGTLILTFTILSITIACFGLFGLITFAAQQKTKEIGVRKVLGASVADITLLLSRDFIKLILIAMLLAAPLAWFCMNSWLQDFAYRVSLTSTDFLIAGGLTAIIVMSTVCVRSIRAASVNPVKSLRSE